MANKSLGRGLSAFLDLNTQEKGDDFEKSINRMEERRAKQAKDQELLQHQSSNEKKEGHESQNMESTPESEENRVIRINISDIVENPYQPRKKFDEEALKSLSESIKRKGVLQPILVIKNKDKKDGDGSAKYQLVAGERRFRASKLAGIADIPAIVTELGQRDQLEIAILENVQREDLNPIEEAEAYKRLMTEFGYTQEQLSEVLGKSRSHIANILRILNLPSDVKDMLQNKALSFGHARALVGAENASEIAKRVVEKNMSVRETEELLKSLKDVKKMMNAASHSSFDGGDTAAAGDISGATSISGEYGSFDFSSQGSDASQGDFAPSAGVSFVESLPASAYIDPELLNIANQISSKVGLQVNIKIKNKVSAAKGGTVEIFFKDLEDLDKLLGRLHGQ